MGNWEGGSGGCQGKTQKKVLRGGGGVRENERGEAAAKKWEREGEFLHESSRSS